MVLAILSDEDKACIKTLVVDDYSPFRSFVCALLRPKAELQIVDQASDGLEAIEKAEKLQPDLVLLDVGLPKLNGIAAARRIREVAPNSKIIFVSQETSPEAVQEALRFGASGYVSKAKAGAELLKAIDAALVG